MKTIQIVALLVPGLLLAQAPGGRAPRKPVFVTPEQVNAPGMLQSPPRNDSWKTLEELAELHKIQETRTAAEVAHAQADDREESFFAFADVLGPKFQRTTLPLTALLSDHIKNDEGVIVNPGKNFFKRPRPYHLDGTLKPVCKTTENREDYAYPSGHGTTGFVSALVLIQMVPEKRDAILARADDYAHSREVCGAHYASDEQASKNLAYAMVGVIANHPQFRKELEAARTETRAALGLPAFEPMAVK